MKKTKEQTISVLSGYVCDSCGYEGDDDNFASISYFPGYSSSLDGENFEHEICETCFIYRILTLFRKT